MHTLHKGRERYIITHSDEKQDGQKARVETFVVGQDIQRGERLQWPVDLYKASVSCRTRRECQSEGLLISAVIKSRSLPKLIYCKQLS